MFFEESRLLGSSVLRRPPVRKEKSNDRTYFNCLVGSIGSIELSSGEKQQQSIDRRNKE
jgi:hypothetical protein